MTDHDIDERVRAWYRGEIGVREPAPGSLYARVAGIPDGTPAPIRVVDRRRSFILLAAATLLVGLLIGAGIAVGSGLLPVPWAIDADAVPPPAPAENGLVAYSAYVDANGLPATPDGQRPAGTREIFVGLPDGSQTRRLTTSPGFKSLPTWSPDGSQIAYLVEDRDWGWEPVGAGELAVLDLSSGQERRIAVMDGAGMTKRYDGLKIAWSPDASQLAYSDGAGLHIVGADGAGHILVNNEACCPAWSPDGTRLVYQDASGLSSYDLETATRTQLARDGTASRPAGAGAHWTPDGSMIVFWSADGIEAVAPDGSGRLLLAAAGRWPSVSPDSGLVAFTAGGDGGESIWIVGLDGTATRLADAGGALVDWSPDGKWIAYQSVTMDGAWLIRPDGSVRRRIDIGPGEAVVPSPWDWQPVGESASPPAPDEALSEQELLVSIGNQTAALDVETGQERMIADGSVIALSPDRTLLVTATNTETIISRVDRTEELRMSGSAVDASWAPDSRRVLLYPGGTREDGDPVWFRLADLASHEVTQLSLVEGGKDVGAGSWSPDGQSIALAAPCWGCLTIADPSGKEQRRVTEECEPWCFAPAWSPDGERIAYGGEGGVRVVDLDGELVLSLPGQLAVWSPDGTRLAYLVGTDLRVVERDGSGDRSVGTMSSLSSRVRWSSDGTRIAYIADSAGGDALELIVIEADGDTTGGAIRSLTRMAPGGRPPFDW